MCGIYASFSISGWVYPNRGLKQLLRNRGPDHVGETTKTSKSGNVSMLFVSTVLSLRGGHVTTQPLTDRVTGSNLCWNGEAWKIGETTIEGNDGEAVLTLLSSKPPNCSQSEAIDHVLTVLRRIRGPCAFIFYDQSHDALYFGRDCLGRRSLLYNIEDFPGAIQFSSVADSASSEWKEVEADGIYVLDLTNSASSPSLFTSGLSSILKFPFPVYQASWNSNADISIPSLSLGKLNSSVPQDASILNKESKSVQNLEHHLSASLKLRVLDIPNPPNSDVLNDVRLAVLFSGGLDCTVLARMADEHLPIDQPVDLLNVAFENPRVIQAAQKQLALHIEKFRNDNISVDSTLFETQQLPSAYEACPDRATGRKAWKELQTVCPMRKWRFVEINVPYSETLLHRDQVVSLIYPHNTEMDLSIAYALYFASRGTGMAAMAEDIEPVPYATPARVLLSGLGADELFGGYTRHASAFARQGFSGLIEELELDINRLGKRNLGRDDRVISNWGREARFPYLDEAIIQWALECPVWEKCGYGTKLSTNPTEGPDLDSSKKVLRLLAQKLGMQSAAREPKRAIQFGARTAKMETGRTKGTTLIS